MMELCAVKWDAVNVGSRADPANVLCVDEAGLVDVWMENSLSVMTVLSDGGVSDGEGTNGEGRTTRWR
jgi:hypothetical protein